MQSTKSSSITKISQAWTDMRPLSLRKKMEHQKSQ
jgi:uncharacterized protein YbdZ (MbtH family)